MKRCGKRRPDFGGRRRSSRECVHAVDAFQKILDLFRRHDVGAGSVLAKQHLTDEIMSWPPEQKMKMRDAWHRLVGEGYVIEGDPRGPTLTPKGRAAVDQLPPS